MQLKKNVKVASFLKICLRKVEKHPSRPSPVIIDLQNVK